MSGIEVKITGLDEELEKIRSLGPTFDKHIIRELNKHGLDWRDDARKNTPVVTGDLRRSMTFEGVEKVGDKIVSTVSNNMEYAEHVEYGHRQEVGRYVPAIGKRLVQPYVPGQYIMTNARARAIQKLPGAIRKAIREAEDELNE